ncbi:CMRF35-like molecule 1 isoform X5 [Lemur catta]|uniref:CMRF35-like molecule 1 isoform X5 n=1 Tax=Lemur catta TaxID=9447 RepID=UPI001E267E70|nr:CMRF35-like molecule 1 isoform X5 [Lemur catta]
MLNAGAVIANNVNGVCCKSGGKGDPLAVPRGYSTAGNPITGPGGASGPERGSLTVQCRYDPEWETHKKWWCRGAVWSSCEILVKTTGSEQEVRKDRVSLRDNQKNHTFTVTMEELRRNDADTYWCGIERTGVDYAVSVKVTTDPGPCSATPTSCCWCSWSCP